MSLLETLKEVEGRRNHAWLKRDADALAAVLDDDFVEINYFGRLKKEEILKDLFLRLTLLEFTMDDFELLGSPDAPVLTYTCFERLRIDGNEISGHFTVASHYVKCDTWKLLLWQLTPIQGS